MNQPINFLLPIKEQITCVENRMRSLNNGHHSELDRAIEHLLSSGGKRIRPAVALLTGRMFKADSDRLIALGAAIELLHTATLVHDDLIDGSLLRRGIATLNAKWSPAATVLTGDFIFAQAASLAADTESVNLMRNFAKTLSTIVNGEITQLFSTYRMPSKEEYFKRIYAKTASLFELASSAATHLGSASESTVEEMRQFGYDIGMAFQIVDDILDFTGAQETVGKPVASDLRQGLITLPFICYMNRCGEDPNVQAILNGEPSKIDQLVKDIGSSGAIDDALVIAQEFISEAKLILKKQIETSERAALLELTDYIIGRTL